MVNKLKEQQEKQALIKKFGLLGLEQAMPLQKKLDLFFHENELEQLKRELWDWLKGYMGSDTGPDTPNQRADALFTYQSLCELFDTLWTLEETVKQNLYGKV